MPVHAIRGATQVDANDAGLVLDATVELITEVMVRNTLTTEDVISVFFTVTTDLDAAFPATAARKAGFHDVPLMCATEIPVPGALPRVVRLMAHVDVPGPRSAVRHVYLRGARALRRDIAR